MTFKMNNRTWEIEEVSADWLLDEYKKECGDATYCFGLCRYSLQKIYLNEEVHEEQKRQTLLHELMHCYVWSYVCGFNNISEEALCDISANSHDIIHEIVEKYFHKSSNIACDIKNNMGEILAISKDGVVLDRNTI